MRYQEAPPAPQLRPAVVCHWSIESGGVAALRTRYTVYPDGCFDILFVLNGAVGREDGATLRTGAAVIGPMTRAAEVETSASVTLMGVRFRPGVASRLIGVPLVELRDAAVPAGELLGRRADELTERLAELPDFGSRTALLDRTLCAWLHASRQDTGTALLDSVLWGARISVLADRFRLSERQVQRIFLRDVGLTPTEVVRLHRFRRAIELLQTGRATNLSALAAHLGYSDHAHFTREFSAFAGLPPSTFLRERSSAGDPGSDLFKRD